MSRRGALGFIGGLLAVISRGCRVRKQLLCCVLGLCLLPNTPALGQEALSGVGQRPELQQSLQQRYPLTIMGQGLLGLRGKPDTIRQVGGTAVVLRAGLYGATERGQAPAQNITGGQLEISGGRKDHAFAPGERLYVHSIYVGSDVVVFGLMSTQLITTPAGTARVWAMASFFFPAKTLHNGDRDAVLRVVEQWIVPEGLRGSAPEPGAFAAPGGTTPAAPPAAPALRAELTPGMTRDQAVSALGEPVREVSFGTRGWLTYTGLILQFENGKLVMVDRIGGPPAKVVVRSEPAGAEVYVDERFVGSAPATLELPAGPHKISVRMAGYKAWQRDLEALAGSEVSLLARLEK